MKLKLIHSLTSPIQAACLLTLLGSIVCTAAEMSNHEGEVRHKRHEAHLKGRHHKRWNRKHAEERVKRWEEVMHLFETKKFKEDSPEVKWAHRHLERAERELKHHRHAQSEHKHHEHIKAIK